VKFLLCRGPNREVQLAWASYRGQPCRGGVSDRKQNSVRAWEAQKAAVFISLWLWCGCQPGANQPPDQPKIPSGGPVLFEDITAQVGLNFIHDSGATGQFSLPEQYGSGCAFLDFDNDDRLDIYLVHGAGTNSPSRNQLFHQEADGTFRNVSEGSGLDVAGCFMGVTVGDVNNDARPDVLVTEYGGARLFLNLGQGRFSDVTAAAGIENSRWSTAAAFFDYDRDGWLDLVIGNYLDYNPTLRCYDAAGTLEFCGPHNFPGTVAKLFHNQGAQDGSNVVRFADVTVSAGLTRALNPALGVLCADFDGDRWPDIFLTDDGRPNRLFMNRRDGTFVEEAALRGLAYNGMGQTAANMGIALGDVNGDGLFDLFVTHLATEQHTLWVQGPRGLFMDQTAPYGLVSPAWRGEAFGDVLADFDHDGWPDLALVNGRIKRGLDPAPRLESLGAFWHPYAQRYQLFLHNGQDRFIDVSLANPAFCGRAGVGRGLACGDIDNDGDLDLLSSCTGGPAQLFRNVAQKRGHWLMIRAVDPAHANRDAYGAEMVIEAGGRRWWRLVQPCLSYMTSHDPRVHVGLGPAESVQSIQVIWPDGTEETFPGGPADRFIVLRKGASRLNL
jgi:hypothetical protein